MLSLYQQINRYNVELNLAINRGWKFSEEGKISPACQGPEASKEKILTIMYDNLSRAPIYYLTGPLILNFLKKVTDYTKTLEKNETKQVKETVKKIQLYLNQSGQYIMSCFQTESAREVNTLLDKSPEALTEKDYRLLSGLANLFAYKRIQGYIFYQMAAITVNINRLRRDCPNLHIENLPDEWLPKIVQKIPTDPSDLQFWLIVQFYIVNHPKHLTERNPEFLKQIIKQKQDSTSADFKQFLNTYLILQGIASLCDEWHKLLDQMDIKRFASSLKATIAKIPDFDRYTADFIHEPPAYIQLCQKTTRWSPLSDEARGYGLIAKELFGYADDTNKPFDAWYGAIYQKIQAYQSLHHEAELPIATPETFRASKDFTHPGDIKIPILAQIDQWEREELKLRENKRIPAKAPSTTFTKKSTPSKPKAFPSAPTEKPESRETTTSEPEAELSEFSEELELELAPQSNSAQEVFPDKSQDIKEETSSPSASVLKPAGIPPRQETDPILLKQLLRKTSPFGIDDRILAWFDPQQKPVGLNEESEFIHNFAWASNEILWRFGMRYPRANDRGVRQPAIAMLCQVDHPAYPTKKLFRVTLTFNQIISGSSFTYHSSLTCYHRTLTQREQNQKDVEDYIQSGKDQFIDFPPLPSQGVNINLPEDLKKTIYPDGSFVESVKGSVITIRDPKNDVSKLPCRIHFFVVR